MKVQLENLGTTTILVPSGRLDFAAAEGFQKQVDLVLTGAVQQPRALIFDCGELEYVSSAGLRVFLMAAKTAQRANIALSLCSLRPAVREVFDLSGFSRVISVHPDRTTALASLPPAAV
jgi:anti-sigma B factor antagonist